MKTIKNLPSGRRWTAMAARVVSAAKGLAALSGRSARRWRWIRWTTRVVSVATAAILVLGARAASLVLDRPLNLLSFAARRHFSDPWNFSLCRQRPASDPGVFLSPPEPHAPLFAARGRLSRLCQWQLWLPIICALPLAVSDRLFEAVSGDARPGRLCCAR